MTLEVQVLTCDRHKKDHKHMTLEVQVLTCDRHKKDHNI